MAEHRSYSGSFALKLAVDDTRKCSLIGTGFLSLYGDVQTGCKSPHRPKTICISEWNLMTDTNSRIGVHKVNQSSRFANAKTIVCCALVPVQHGG
jgi:hypothetical protein